MYGPGVQSRVNNQQEAELQGVAWAVRLACRFGWRAVTIFTDNMAAGYQAVGLRAKTWLRRQMRVLRALVWQLAVSGMVVRFVWVPSALEPEVLTFMVRRKRARSRARGHRGGRPHC